ncbi:MULTISPECIES: phage baseplate protein [Enterobacteriaceae]|uniref:phage baseplate protein n=1 Tax=Enterobacteriaceae TaxID=543 RepID=UPI0006429DE1|nr:MULTISPECIES: hypothetical protein [Enterobacteriaceae]EKS9203556.1 hypothetical protein [Enterobacter cloacae]HCM9575915.1 hypothetical protein [Enterobacter kobei]APK16059.1 hypothetical protein RG37_12615 [Escherichia coli]APK39630.1 hypothetical protein RG42_13430 [Escherichia coli]EGH1140169.1 hypothetical protein [Escherichia coli]
MADILLKYLTDLPSAADAEPSDLMHINQAGNDRSITLEVLASAIFNIRYPVGKVEWFANDTNPNAIWSGSTWARIPGMGKTIRLANSTGTDVLQQGGSDTVEITSSNLPPHKHPINVKTESFDYGSKSTSSTGSHVHAFAYRRNGNSSDSDPGGDVMKSGSGTKNESRNTESAGNHQHSVSIGAHEHDIKGDTDSVGGGTPLSLTNAYVKLAAWYRTA